MNWMQYILDNCSTLEEAVQCAYKFAIDGWGWHYFIGDASGNTAAISFKKGEVVIHQGENMPVPALFNSPYGREMELIKYFKGFGGEYAAELDNPEVPRFVKTAVMLDEYDTKDDIVDYGMMMLDKLMVNDIPEWSILCDVTKMQVHFKTRINPEIKIISFADIDFSNSSPVVILNMDIAEGGKINDRFTPYTNQKMKEFTENYILPIIPEELFTSGGISIEEYVENTSNHTDAAGLKINQPFVGTWKNKPGEDQEDGIVTVIIESKGESIMLRVSNDEKSFYDASHLQLISNKLVFTFITDRGYIIEVNASFSGNSMEVSFDGIEDHYGRYALEKVSS
jgi:choloylglycine hydrolase